MKKTISIAILALSFYSCANGETSSPTDFNKRPKFRDALSSFYTQKESNVKFEKMIETLDDAMHLAGNKEDSCQAYLGYLMINTDHNHHEEALRYNDLYCLDCLNDSIAWISQKISINMNQDDVMELIYNARQGFNMAHEINQKSIFALNLSLAYSNLGQNDSACNYIDFLKSNGRFDEIDHQYKKNLPRCTP